MLLSAKASLDFTYIYISTSISSIISGNQMFQTAFHLVMDIKRQLELRYKNKKKDFAL